MTKQSGYATKQTGYFWTKQLGLNNDLANEKILAMYQPLLTKESVIDGVWDEDLYQELCIQLFLCIRKFRM